MDDRGFVLDPTASVRHVYSKLEDQEVRMLLISPGPRNGLVDCEIQVVANTRNVQYEALSYVWGNVKKSKTITCNGLKFPVTESLFHALSNLRYVDSWRRIWVDQLCINQMSNPEVMSQVSKMGMIYSNATRVVVWLGTSDRKLSQAWHLLQETALSLSLARSDFLSSSPSTVSQASSPPRNQKRPRVSKRYDSTSTLSSKSSGLTSSSRESLSSMSSGSPPRSYGHDTSSRSPARLKNCLAIFQHVWFSRKWTFQEIVLADAAIFCCGDVEMAFSDLTSWYFHYASKIRSSSILYDSVGYFENIINIRNELDKETLKLSNLLMLTRQRQSTRPQDAIYALLGLIPGLANRVQAASQQCLELFTAAFQHCLEHEHDLSIISAAGLYNGTSSDKDWPSWLPDWRESTPLRPLVLSADRGRHDDEFCAAGTSVPDVSLTGHTLRVKGVRIGCICTRKGSWPSTYFIPGTTASKLIVSTVTPSSFSKPVAELDAMPVVISDTRTSQYSLSTMLQAQKQNATCEPLRAAAAVQTADWVCMFHGGPVLYVVRPLRFPVMNKPARSQHQDQRDMKNVRCRFVGECAINVLMSGVLTQHVSDSDEMVFELE